eukprot:scaffold54356_cov45-Attheya_sp.AAC.2
MSLLNSLNILSLAIALCPLLVATGNSIPVFENCSLADEERLAMRVSASAQKMSGLTEIAREMYAGFTYRPCSTCFTHGMLTVDRLTAHQPDLKIIMAIGGTQAAAAIIIMRGCGDSCHNISIHSFTYPSERGSIAYSTLHCPLLEFRIIF